MSRAFVAASSDYLASSSAIVTAYGFDVAVWFKPGSLGANPQILWYTGDTAGGSNYWAVGISASGYPILLARNNSVNDTITHTTAVTVGDWNLIVGRFTSDSSRTISLNGDAGTTGTTTVTTPAGIDATAIGRLHRSSPIWYANGEIDDVVVWGNTSTVTSTVEDLLYAGWDARIVAPTGIIGYAPLRKNESPEIDLVWSGTYSVTGADYSKNNRPTPTTKVEKSYSGRITVDNGMSTSRWTDASVNVTKSIVSGKLKLAATDNAAEHVIRGITDGTSDTDYELGVTDAVICAKVSNIGADNGPAVIRLKNGSGTYDLQIPITAGGTAAIRKNGTNQQTVTKGIANAAEKEVKFWRIGSTIDGIVDGTAFTAFTDGTPITGEMEVLLGAPNNGSGTSDWRFDDLSICESNTVTIEGPAGGSAQLHDLAGNLVAEGTVSGGKVQLDCSAAIFPLAGRLRVYTDSAYTTLAADGELYANDIRGGDWYTYDSPVIILGAEFIAQYATTQADSSNGLIIDGDMAYGVAYGCNGSILGLQKDLTVPGSTVITEIEPEGTCLDQHSPVSIVRDSANVMRIAYGVGDRDVRYREAVTSNDTQAWGAATDVVTGANANMAMLIDQDDDCYLIGTQTYIGKQCAVFRRKPAGSAWGSMNLIGQPDGTWMFYLSDVRIGVETSGQKALWAAWFMYDGSTGYRDALVTRSVDKGVNWKGLSGGNFTLPLTTTSGVVGDSNAIAHSGTGGYVSRFALGADGTYAHLAMYDLGSGYPKYKRGTIGTSWDSFTKDFTSVNTHGAMADVDGTLTYVWAGPSPNRVGQYWSVDEGDNWSGPNALVTSSRSSSPPQYYWAKLTPSADGLTVYALWQARGTCYEAGTNTISGEGCGSLFMTQYALPQRITLTPAAETDAAQALDVDKPLRVTLTAATETDAAVALTFIQPVSITPAAETDVAQAVTAAKYVTLTPATETGAAQTLSVSKSATITPASETDTAVALSLGSVSLTPAVETDTAVPLVVTKPIHVALTPAGEVDVAVSLTALKAIVVTITPATETDAAQQLEVSKSATVTPALETDAATAIFATKPLHVTVTPAAETDQAVALTIGGSRVTLTPATETDAAVTVTFTKPIRVTLSPALEADAAIAAERRFPGVYTLTGQPTRRATLTGDPSPAATLEGGPTP